MSSKKLPRLDGKAIMAPMHEVTDIAFRVLVKRYGAAMAYTEFVHGTAILRGNEKIMDMMRVDPTEHPVGIQIFGSDIDDIVMAGKTVEENFDVIDLNCGCPAYRIISQGAGCRLMKNPAKIHKLVSGLVDAVKKPVTVKIRAGIKWSNANAVEVAKTVEDAGASAVTVHGRSQEQGYSGKADWNIIKKVKESVSIPVIGNGDIDSPEMYEKRLKESGVDYIMIGRAAMSNPYIFRQIADYLKNGEYDKKSGIEQFFEYYELAKEYEIGFNNIKNHALWMLKGMKGAKTLREEIARMKNEKDLLGVLKS